MDLYYSRLLSRVLLFVLFACIDTFFSPVEQSLFYPIFAPIFASHIGEYVGKAG